MLYTSGSTSFKHQVHPTLQRRIRLFILIGVIALALVAYDVVTGTLGPWLALLGVVIGFFVGVVTSRIYHLSWSKDGAHVVGRIDRIGWVVLVLYILFEIARNFFFQNVLGYAVATTTAITFAFVASALISRVFGLRGRILRILREQQVLGS